MRMPSSKAVALMLVVISSAAYSAESGFFVGAEVNRGGALVYSDSSFEMQTHQVRVREGDNITGKIGYDLLLGNNFAVRGAVGYAFSQDNSFDTKTNHVPMELMFFFRNKSHRFGVGPVAHFERNVNSVFPWTYNKAANTTTNTAASVTQYYTTTKAKDKAAVGFKLEYNYEMDSGLYVGAQYTYMRYKYDNKYYVWDEAGDSSQTDYAGYVVDSYTGKTNASSAGVTIGYRF